MESEQRLSAREPVALDLENEDLANANQITKKTNTVDATDALPKETEDGSPEAEEVTEESTGEPTGEVSVPEEDRIVEYDDNNNNEEETNPQPDVRRKNGMQLKLTRGRRYFDPPESSLEECEEEYKRGKKSKAKKKRKPCYICGEIGHQGDRCNKVFNCSICSKKGNLLQDSPDKNVDVDCTSGICLMCGYTGHDMFSCTNNYDPEDLKAIECYVCRKTGHLCCVENKTEEPREISCYNCGKIGHFGSDCPCPKPNKVADNRQQLCSKCTKAAKAESKKEAAAAKAAKKRARSRARRWKARTVPTVNASYQVQPSIWRGPPIVGPYYRNPGANVWLSPAAAAAARTGPNHPIEASPSHQPIYDHQVQVGTQVLTHFPRLDRSSQNEAEIPKPPVNQESGTMLPQTKTDTGNQIQQKPFYPTSQLHPMGALPSHQPINHHQVQVGTQVLTRLPRLDGSSQNEAQIPKLPVNQETGTMLPQTKTNTGNQVQQKLFYPTSQLHPIKALPSRQPIYLHQVEVNTQVLTHFPHLEGSSQNKAQIPKLPVNQETGTMLPQTIDTGSQVQQKPFYPTSQLHPIEALPSLQPIYHTGNQVQQKPYDPMSQLHWREALPSRQPYYHHPIGGNQVLSQIQREPFYPMSQLPQPIWNSHRDAQIPQPPQSGHLLPQTESRVPQNSSCLPPHLVYNGDQRSPGYPTASLIRQEQNRIEIPFPPENFNR